MECTETMTSQKKDNQGVAMSDRDTEEEQCTVIQKLGDSGSLDNVEDVAMQSEDGGNEDPTFLDADHEVASEDDKVIGGKKAVPKGKSGVCCVLQILQR